MSFYVVVDVDPDRDHDVSGKRFAIDRSKVLVNNFKNLSVNTSHGETTSS